MKAIRALPVLLSALLLAGASTFAAAQYELGPDSRPQPGVPKGEVLKFSFENSRIFPGTYRDYWVYVPAQYRADKPACLYVNQDGVQWQAPTVFDNLIHKGEMPVTIGVFVMHGRVRAKDGSAAQDRFNRSFEYDGLGDRYARFIAEELLPEVETKKSADGRAIRLSKDPNDRAIGGSSSGAVCAFTAAWERPDLFRRVFSAIGTYVGLRGADRYPTLIRKLEPKPLRVFLQDGSNDLNIYAGDWWMANQMMERALSWAGYEVTHVWGEGGHNGQHGTAIFPDAMRWLWKDYPQPVKSGKGRNDTLNALLAPGEPWQAVTEGHSAADALAANGRGEVFFTDAGGTRSYRLSDGRAVPFTSSLKRSTGQAFGPDGRLYAVAGEGRILAFDQGGKAAQVATGIAGRDLVVASNGNVYVTEPGPAGAAASKVWLVKGRGEKQVVDTGLLSASGVTLSPDQKFLYVADAASHWVYSYQVQPDGTLQHKQQYHWLHVPDNRDDSGAGGMCVDRDGRLYVATAMGVQVCDQPGRVNAILPLPLPREGAADVCFGGEKGDTLYVASGGKMYRRKSGFQGRHAWQPPNKPPRPGL